MDKLLSLISEEFDEEHYKILIELVEKRYNITLDQIIESKDQEEVSDNVYYALDMLMVDPIKWCNLKLLKNDPKLDINFINELKKYTCQFEKKCKNTKNATEYGHLECLKYLHENGAPWDEWTCNYAAEYGHLDCLKYLHENGCSWNKWTCAFAAKNGNLDCLKYLHKNGCSWDNHVCSYAAKNGHLECLIYAHENGCPWNEWVCNFAIQEGKLECLKYAVENGCPYIKSTCIHYAKKNNHLDCVEYLKSL